MKNTFEDKEIGKQMPHPMYGWRRDSEEKLPRCKRVAWGMAFIVILLLYKVFLG